ncbi:MAG: hypothetical protein ACREL4_11105 [Gemmatimonadales bacterium]
MAGRGGAGRAFVMASALSPAQQELFAHGNWERLARQELHNP